MELLILLSIFYFNGTIVGAYNQIVNRFPQSNNYQQPSLMGT